MSDRDENLALYPQSSITSECISISSACEDWSNLLLWFCSRSLIDLLWRLVEYGCRLCPGDLMGDCLGVNVSLKCQCIMHYVAGTVANCFIRVLDCWPHLRQPGSDHEAAPSQKKPGQAVPLPPLHQHPHLRCDR